MGMRKAWMGSAVCVLRRGGVSGIIAELEALQQQELSSAASDCQACCTVLQRQGATWGLSCAFASGRY